MRLDSRNARTEKRIEDALLAVLGETNLSEASVSEVASRAGVSRSTFYAHFNNLGEVYERLLDRFVTGLRPLEDQLGCDGCDDACSGEPFCMRVRNAGELSSVASDPQFFARTVGRFLQDDAETSAGLLERDGVPADIARAVSLFQLCGCHAAATHVDGDGDWERVQEALDIFIAAGMDALRRFYGEPANPA